MKVSDVGGYRQGYRIGQVLDRAAHYTTLEQLLEIKSHPSNSSLTTRFSRYKLSNSAIATPNAAGVIKYISEGVTPAANSFTREDVNLVLTQIGDVVPITDVVKDTYEDDVFNEASEALADNAGAMLEIIKWKALTDAGTVLYANGSAKNQVNTAMTLNIQRRALRALQKSWAKPITKINRSTGNLDTYNVAPSYYAVCHTDLEHDIRKMDGFIPAEKYGSISNIEGEFGKVDQVRYISTPFARIWTDGGGVKGTMLSTSGTNADVYAILLLGKGAGAASAFKGSNAIKLMIRQPDTPDSNDMLGQNGSVGWKGYHGACILNTEFMIQINVAATAL